MASNQCDGLHKPRLGNLSAPAAATGYLISDALTIVKGTHNFKIGGVCDTAAAGTTRHLPTGASAS